MEADPSQFVPNPCSGKGTVEEGGPSITLDLGIGNGEVKVGVVLKFRPEQLSELEQQRRIFNCIASGVTVPPHILVPIRDSVAAIASSASSSAYGGDISQHYPSFTGFSTRGFYRWMDPSPWRCRRTDGRKWRCSKHVVADQKYCERHMHRGRQRSRKHVEVSQSDGSPNIVPIAAMGELNNRVAHSKDKNGVCVVDSENERNNHGIDGKGDDHNHVGGNATGVGHNAIMSESVELSFSPDSVLQGSNTASCSSNLWNRSTKIEPEPGRCIRTDGKKWRCSRDVIPYQKYCERHVNRNAKKPVLLLKTATPAAPNTNISFSITTSPPPANNNENATTSSSGDTTISDASVNVSENGTVLL